ncbi:MAG: phytoene/squalene synthase family protein [Luteolibacter sp.]
MALLKRVSRSFYLSVRLLPAPMRRGVCIGYLLARASDTLADTQKDPSLLDAFAERLQSPRGAGIQPTALSPADPGEKQLLAELPEVFQAFASLPETESALIREVVTIILSGQRLDMRRFGAANAGHIVSLASEEELEDYTWRVAGCVGQFWTRLGFLTLGEDFSRMDPESLEAHGIRFGQGLQLVNILRDTAEDLALGRNYLPCARETCLLKARENLGDGLIYANAMRLKRLHVAVALPVRIGLDTLDAIETAGPRALETRIKIPRRRVWLHFAAACKSSLSRRHG